MMQGKSGEIKDSPEHQSFMKEVKFAIYTRELCQIPATAYHKAAEDYALHGTLYPSHDKKPQTCVNGSSHKEGTEIRDYRDSLAGDFRIARPRAHRTYKKSKAKKNTFYPFMFQTNYSPFAFSQISNYGVNSIAMQRPTVINSNQLPMCYSSSAAMYPLSFMTCHWYYPFQTVFVNAPQYYDAFNAVMK